VRRLFCNENQGGVPLASTAPRPPFKTFDDPRPSIHGGKPVSPGKELSVLTFLFVPFGEIKA
jgi:hypothetical protein